MDRLHAACLKGIAMAPAWLADEEARLALPRTVFGASIESNLYGSCKWESSCRLAVTGAGPNKQVQKYLKRSPHRNWVILSPTKENDPQQHFTERDSRDKPAKWVIQRFNTRFSDVGSRLSYFISTLVK
jgi:hypothetical protein